MKNIYYSFIFISPIALGQCLSNVNITTANYSIIITKSSNYITINSSTNIDEKIELNADPIDGFVLMNAGFVAEPSSLGSFLAQTLEGCGNTLPQKMNLDSADDNKNFNIQIYPNPIDDVLNINFGIKTDVDFAFQLYDASGKLFLRKEIKKGFKNIAINISELVSGNYIYKIISKNHIKTGIIIKK